MSLGTIRSMSAAVILAAAIGCSGNSAGSARGPTESSPTASLDAFVGTWRSVTPSLEFIGLSIVSKSSELGAIGTRLTFSGVAFDGSGRIDGDSLVANMTISGTTQASGLLIARTRDGKTLHVERRDAPGAPSGLTLDFVRQE